MSKLMAVVYKLKYFYSRSSNTMFESDSALPMHGTMDGLPFCIEVSFMAYTEYVKLRCRQKVPMIVLYI